MKSCLLFVFGSLFVLSACGYTSTSSSFSVSVTLPSDADTRPDTSAVLSRIKAYLVQRQYDVIESPLTLRATKAAIGSTVNRRKAIVLEVQSTYHNEQTHYRVISSTEPFLLSPSDRKYTPWEAAAAQEMRETTLAIIEMLPLEWNGTGR